MKLMQKSNEGDSISLGCLLPIHPLTLKVSGAKDRLTLTTCGLMDFARGFRPQPAALDRGLVTQVRCINTQDRSVLLIAFRSNGCDNLVHPLFFSTELGACAGIVLAKRFYTQPPRFNALFTVLSLASRPC